MLMLDELRKIPLFADLSEEDLERLYQMAETVSIPAGEPVLREGDQGDSLFVVLDGELEVTKRQDSQDVLLRPRFTTGITITRDYAEEVPRIEAYGSELNQVWTNLIDNAIDALAGQGELTLRAFTAESVVAVDVLDDGPGIPQEIQPRIFEPFYTTKDTGAGTGLGLHIAYNIIVQKHRGQPQVASRPGETRFRVVLPITLAGNDASVT
jgi:signal transduction histidine kinase